MTAGSTYPLQKTSISLDDSSFQERRQQIGHLSLRPEIQLEWIMQQREDAIKSTVAGDLSGAALLSKIILTDPVFNGVFNTRVSGTCSLPRRFRGLPEHTAALELGHDSIRSVFDSMVDPTQLRLMLADYLMLGVSIGELIDVPGRDYPVLRRLDPQWLRYRWTDPGGTGWYYNSVLGPVSVRPGDGRWVMMENGVSASPWERGLYLPNSQIYIQKFTCILESMNYERGLANPVIIASAPQGANDLDRGAWQEAWSNVGLNTVLTAPPGYTATAMQAGSVGFEAFQKTIARCNEEFIIAVAGNLVSTQGNSGFSSSNIYRDIKTDLIKDAARALEWVINSQILPQWVVKIYGVGALEQPPCIEFDTEAPKSPVELAQAWTQLAAALPAITQALAAVGKELDIDEVIARFSLPIKSTEIMTRGQRAASDTYDIVGDESEAEDSEDSSIEAEVA